MGRSMRVGAVGLALLGTVTAGEAREAAPTGPGRDEARPAGTRALVVKDPVAASALLNLRIEDRLGAEVGEMKDVLVHIPSGEVPYYVVSLGSVLGEDLWVLPSTVFSAVRRGTELGLSVDDVRQRRPYSPAEWPDLDNSGFWSGAYPVDERQVATRAKSVFRATDIIGENVETRRGEDVGEVRDLLIDIGSGKASHLVVEVGGPGLAPDRLVAVPVTRFAAPPAPPHTMKTLDSLLMDMTRDELNALPKLDPATVRQSARR